MSLESRHRGSFIQVIQTNLQTLPDKQIIHFTSTVSEANTNDSFSYRDLDIKARGIAAYLQSAGVNPGDRVVLTFMPGLDFVYCLIGCMYAGVIAVPTYPPLTEQYASKMQAIIINSTPKLILTHHFVKKQFALIKKLNQLDKLPLFNNLLKLTSKHIQEVAKSELPTIERNSFVDVEMLNLNELAQSYVRYEADENDIMFLQYTSGSTGDPKGVKVSHKNLLANAQVMSELTDLTEDSKIFCWMPMYHDMALIGNILQTIYSKNTLYLTSPMDFIKNPLSWLSSISQYQITHTGGPNFAYSLATNSAKNKDLSGIDLSSLTHACCGAESIRADTWRNFYNAFERCGLKESSFFPCYGLAEATLAVSGDHLYDSRSPVVAVDKQKLKHNIVEIKDDLTDVNVQPMVSCGKIALDVKIVNPTTRRSCAPNKVGEVWIAGDSVASGYYNNIKASHDTFRARILNQNDNKEYLRTGDLGFIYNDELFIAGRIKDTIIVNGANYYPQDIELLIESAHEQVKPGKSAVFEVASKNGTGLGVVFAIRNYNISEDELKKIAATVMERIMQEFKLPVAHLSIVAGRSILKTTSGKLRRQAIKLAQEKNKLSAVYDYVAERSQDFVDINKKYEPQIKVENQKFAYERIMHEVVTTVADIVGVESSKIQPETDFIFYGVDSIKYMQIKLAFRDKFDLEVTFLNNERISNAKELADYIYGEIIDFENATTENTAQLIAENVLDPECIILKTQLPFLRYIQQGHETYFTLLLDNIKNLQEHDLIIIYKKLAEKYTSFKKHLVITDDSAHFSIPENYIPHVERKIVHSETEMEYYKKKCVRVDFPLSAAGKPLVKVELLTYEGQSYIWLAIDHILFDGYSLSLLRKDLFAVLSAYPRIDTLQLGKLYYSDQDIKKYQDQYFEEGDSSMVTECRDVILKYSLVPEQNIEPVSFTRVSMDKVILEQLTMAAKKAQLSIKYILQLAYSSMLHTLSGLEKVVYKETYIIHGEAILYRKSYFSPLINTAIRLSSQEGKRLDQFIVDNLKLLRVFSKFNRIPYYQLVDVSINLPEFIYQTPHEDGFFISMDKYLEMREITWPGLFFRVIHGSNDVEFEIIPGKYGSCKLDASGILDAYIRHLLALIEHVNKGNFLS